MHGALADIPPVDEDAPLRRLVKSAYEVDERALSRARLPHDGDVCSLRHIEREVFEDVLSPVRIAEGDVVKADMPVKPLPIFALGREAVAVCPDDFGGIFDVALRGEQRRHTLDVDLHRDEVGKAVHRPLHGLHDALRVRHEHGERADKEEPVRRQRAAVPKNERERRRGGKGDDRHKERAEMPDPRRALLHLLRRSKEAGIEIVLDEERLARLHARHPFVEGARDRGVELARLTVEFRELFLKVDGDECHERDDDDDAERQNGLQSEHDDDRTHDIDDVPHARVGIPRDIGGDVGRIAHHAGVQPPHAVLAVVGDRERLQMIETGAPDVAQEMKFQLAAVIARDEIEDAA